MTIKIHNNLVEGITKKIIAATGRSIFAKRIHSGIIVHLYPKEIQALFWLQSYVADIISALSSAGLTVARLPLSRLQISRIYYVGRIALVPKTTTIYANKKNQLKHLEDTRFKTITNTFATLTSLPSKTAVQGLERNSYPDLVPASDGERALIERTEGIKEFAIEPDKTDDGGINATVSSAHQAVVNLLEQGYSADVAFHTTNSHAWEKKGRILPSRGNGFPVTTISSQSKVALRQSKSNSQLSFSDSSSETQQQYHQHQAENTIDQGLDARPIRFVPEIMKKASPILGAIIHQYQNYAMVPPKQEIDRVSEISEQGIKETGAKPISEKKHYSPLPILTTEQQTRWRFAVDLHLFGGKKIIPAISSASLYAHRYPILSFSNAQEEIAKQSDNPLKSHYTEEYFRNTACVEVDSTASTPMIYPMGNEKNEFPILSDQLYLSPESAFRDVSQNSTNSIKDDRNPSSSRMHAYRTGKTFAKQSLKEILHYMTTPLPQGLSTSSLVTSPRFGDINMDLSTFQLPTTIIGDLPVEYGNIHATIANNLVSNMEAKSFGPFLFYFSSNPDRNYQDIAKSNEDDIQDLLNARRIEKRPLPKPPISYSDLKAEPRLGSVQTHYRKAKEISRNSRETNSGTLDGMPRNVHYWTFADIANVLPIEPWSLISSNIIARTVAEIFSSSPLFQASSVLKIKDPMMEIPASLSSHALEPLMQKDSIIRAVQGQSNVDKGTLLSIQPRYSIEHNIAQTVNGGSDSTTITSNRQSGHTQSIYEYAKDQAEEQYQSISTTQYKSISSIQSEHGNSISPEDLALQPIAQKIPFFGNSHATNVFSLLLQSLLPSFVGLTLLQGKLAKMHSSNTALLSVNHNFRNSISERGAKIITQQDMIKASLKISNPYVIESGRSFVALPRPIMLPAFTPLSSIYQSKGKISGSGEPSGGGIAYSKMNNGIKHSYEGVLQSLSTLPTAQQYASSISDAEIPKDQHGISVIEEDEEMELRSLRKKIEQILYEELRRYGFLA